MNAIHQSGVGLQVGVAALLVLAVAGCMPGGSDRMVLRKAPIVRAELVRTVASVLFVIGCLTVLSAK